MPEAMDGLRVANTIAEAGGDESNRVDEGVKVASIDG